MLDFGQFITFSIGTPKSPLELKKANQKTQWLRLKTTHKPVS